MAEQIKSPELAQDAHEQGVSAATLDNFVKLVRKAIFLTPEEETYFKAIPDAKWRKIFEVNFNGNYAYADRVILKKFREIKATDMQRVEREKSKIPGLDKCGKMLNAAIDAGEPVFFVTDIDNDGSFSQSIIYEFLRADPTAAKNTKVEYTQTVNGNAARGLTVDHVDKLVDMHGVDPEGPMLLVTADNGINSRDEVEKIQARFPQAKIIVTDHHEPEPGMVVREDPKTLIFNPHGNGVTGTTEFYEKFNISGAATVGVLLRHCLEKRQPLESLPDERRAAVEVRLENITNLSRIANLLDYVHSDPMDKPEKDYVVTKFLQLQGLMNVNNSLSRIIVSGIPQKAIAELKKKVPDLDEAVVEQEARNIESQNFVARMLLKIIRENKDSAEDLDGPDFGPKLVAEMARPENFEGLDKEVNPNFIEQLRPVIFSLSVDEEKSAFQEKLCEAMVECYESIRTSEKKLAEQLRRGVAMDRSKLPNSSIGYADPAILSTFNRKFLGKVYNDENPGFLCVLDSASPSRRSGSFRSIYDISKILPEADKNQLEFELNVKIMTPGHQKAAGFILESPDPELSPITDDTVAKINEFIDRRIGELRAAEASSEDTHLLTDLSAIGLIDRINQVIRGSISNFERIVPLLKLTPDTIWTDSYTTQQHSMADIANAKRFGYVSINTDFHGGTVIVPVELIRRVVAGGYKDYMAINYMDGGVFMAERVVPPETAPNIKDMRGSDAKSRLIHDVFEKDLKDTNVVKLTRDQIKDNPFFKYNDFGKADFNLFERMVIGLIDTQRIDGEPIDTLAVFDVEANGFGNGKLMNFGAMNYSVVPGVGRTCPVADFKTGLFQNQRGREFLLTPEQMSALVPVQAVDKLSMPLERRKMLLMKRFPAQGQAMSYDVYYDYPDSARDDTSTPGLGPIAYVNNHAEIGGKIVYNREIQAEMIAYLIKDDDFKVPQEMTNLTGITQEHLDRHGKPTAVADAEIAGYYKERKVLFGAHNTPYDARIMRANAPRTYETLARNAVYDSALFCKEDKLAYDDVMVSSFRNVEKILDGIHFYDNPQSDFSLTDFLADEKDGYYPDRTGNYLLGRQEGNYYLVDKVKHETVKLNPRHKKVEGDDSQDELPLAEHDEHDAQAGAKASATGILLGAKTPTPIPNTSIKYSVEKLSEQWMTHALLLHDEPFDIQHVDLASPEFATLLPFESQLIFFQDNYLFDASAEKNIEHFCSAAFMGAPAGATPDKELLDTFVSKFLELNADIQQKFTDSWMYKSVLGILEPKAREDKNNDYVDLVHFQTQIPKHKIRLILGEARNFKSDYNVEHLLQHEGHVNGPWDGDHKGDIAFEDKLTLTMLAKRMYNPYARDLTPAIERFAEAARKAKLGFDLSHHLADGAAHDSYSYRQGLLYKRAESSPMVAAIQAKEAKLADKDAVHVIKLKLDNDVLPDETSVRAIVRQGVSLSRSDIVRDAQMLDFILVNEQARSSLDNAKSAKTREELEMILAANDKISLSHKQDLSTRYRYVELSKREGQLKKMLSTCLKIVDGKRLAKAPKPDAFRDMLVDDFAIVEKILRNQVGLRPPTQDLLDCADMAQALIDNVRKQRGPSRLEAALADAQSTSFSDFSQVRDPYFLNELESDRKDPIHALLFKHPHLRMGNALLRENIEQAAPSPIRRGRKIGA